MASPRMTAKPVAAPAIYARVSTADQDCALQLRELEEYCRRMGWPKPVEYIDHGFSGKLTSRPRFDEVMRAALAGEVDVILVWKLDRFGRNTRHLLESIEKLDLVSCRFVAIKDNIDTDKSNPSGRLLLTILAAIAEFERETIKERAAAGRMVKFANGEPDSWNLTFGFERGKPVIKEPHAELIRALFRWRDEEHSITEIVRRFTKLAKEKGVKPRRGKKWWATVLLTWLRCRQYVSEYRRGTDADGQPQIFELPRIIEQDLFDRVQSKMDAVKAKTVGNPKIKWLWTGFLYSDCGGSMGGSNFDGFQYMRCHRSRGREKAEPEAPCGCRLCRVERLEPVWKAIWAVSTDPERLRRNVAALVREEESKQPRRGRDARAELAKLERDKTAIALNLNDGDMLEFRETNKLKLSAVREKIAALEREVRALGKLYQMPAKSLFEATCAALASKPEPKHAEARRIVFEGIRNLRVQLDGDFADVTGEMPLAGIVSKPNNCEHWSTGVQNSSVIPAPFKLRVKLARVA